MDMPMGCDEEEIEEIFNEAVLVISMGAPPDLSNESKLELYSYYKQSTEGKCNKPRPGIFNFTEKAKWDSWNKLGDTDPIDSMKKYSELVHKYIPDWDPWKKVRDQKNLDNTQYGAHVSRFDNFEDEVPSTIIEFITTGNKEKVSELLNKGVDPNFKNESGISALHMAIDRNKLEIAQLLVEKGAQVNILDNEGSTPLHYACYLEQPDLIEWLLNKDADSKIKNENGETPEDLYDLRSLRKNYI